MILSWKLEVNIHYVAHELQGISFPWSPFLPEGGSSLQSATGGREGVRESGVLQAGVGTQRSGGYSRSTRR